jgi:hypothetical protein
MDCASNPFRNASSVLKGGLTPLDAASGISSWMTLFSLRKTYASFWETHHPPGKHQSLFRETSTHLCRMPEQPGLALRRLLSKAGKSNAGFQQTF